MRISDWSSDVCSSDLIGLRQPRRLFGHIGQARSLPVIPAKAGIHEHRLFRTGTAVFMDPRLRGGDGRLDNPLFHQPAGWLRHPLHLVGDGAQLFVEDDLVQLAGEIRQLRLPVLLPEELRVGKPRGEHLLIASDNRLAAILCIDVGDTDERSEEHTSELQSLMRISYAVFCLKKKKNKSKN